MKRPTYLLGDKLALDIGVENEFLFKEDEIVHLPTPPVSRLPVEWEHYFTGMFRYNAWLRWDKLPIKTRKLKVARRKGVRLEDAQVVVEFLTLSEVAIMLGASDSTVNRMIDDGKLNAIKLGKGYRISSLDIRDMMIREGTRERVREHRRDKRKGGRDERERLDGIRERVVGMSERG